MKVNPAAFAQVANQTQSQNQAVSKVAPAQQLASFSANLASQNPEKVAESNRTRHEPENKTKQRNNNNKQDEDRQTSGKKHQKMNILV